MRKPLLQFAFGGLLIGNNATKILWILTAPFVLLSPFVWAYRKLRLLISFSLILLLLSSTACGDKFNRTLAALETAPALIDSFTNSSNEEKRQYKQYFSNAVSALRAYRVSKDSRDWNEFVRTLDEIARGHVSDERGQARVTAIVAFIRVLFGIPTRAGVKRETTSTSIAPPDTIEISDEDVKKLEKLMEPLP